MAKYFLPDSTPVEVVAICGEKVIVKEMTLARWFSLAKKPGWQYIAYQKGYSAYTAVQSKRSG